MKLVLYGYGKMGKMIEQIAIQRGHEIVGKINSAIQNVDCIQDADICLEFTHPSQAINNIRNIIKFKKNFVSGTTGWYDSIDSIKALVHKENVGAVCSPNFSIGVYVMMQAIREASRWIHHFPEYDVAGCEWHHAKKADSPSGTAKEISKVVASEIKRIKDVPFSSVRCGSMPGVHSLVFDSPFDTLTITHECRNREGLALGAVLAAEWIHGKQGFYTFADCLK